MFNLEDSLDKPKKGKLTRDQLKLTGHSYFKALLYIIRPTFKFGDGDTGNPIVVIVPEKQAPGSGRSHRTNLSQLEPSFVLQLTESFTEWELLAWK